MRLPRILVVDDDPGMLRAVERVLGQDYEVAGTRLPREALRIMHEFKPDLAVVDVRMPEMDGFELTHQLKSIRDDMDIILMTGSVQPRRGLHR